LVQGSRVQGSRFKGSRFKVSGFQGFRVSGFQFSGFRFSGGLGDDEKARTTLNLSTTCPRSGARLNLSTLNLEP
jgi:hypothetical protein